MNKFLTKIIGGSLAIAMMIGVGAGVNVTKTAKAVDATAYTNVYSADFTTVAGHSYTQNKTFTLGGKSWTSSVSQVQSNVFYLGTNSNNASKGILNNNATFSDVVTAVKVADSQYNTTYETAHCYALLFDNAYDDIDAVEFAWVGGNNAFQVYLFGDSGSGYELLDSENYATSGASVSGSVSWETDSESVDFAKFAIVARPGTPSTNATNKTLRASTFTLKRVAGITPTGITLNHNELTLNVCEQSQLTATLQPDGAEGTVVWTSDHTNIATVTNGLVTGVAEGTATITATVGSLSTTCAVTVNAVPEPAVEEKTIAQFKALENNKAHAYLVSGTISAFSEGDTKDMFGNMTLTDDDVELKIYGSTMTSSALAWNNGNAYAFTNPKDFITNATSNALAIGSVITMKLIRADYQGTIQGSGVITYIAPVAATAIELDKTAATVDTGGEIVLVPTLTPLTATSTITWESSDEAIATVANGVVTGVSAGTATITAKVSDSIKAECEITVTAVLTAVLKYTGNSNKTAADYEGNALTQILNLDSNIFSVVYDKNGAGNDMALRGDGIRMYATKQTTNGNKITVSMAKEYTIRTINIDFDDGYSSTASVFAGSATVTATEGVYTINGSDFTVFNDNSSAASNTQVRFQKIDIVYRAATPEEIVERTATTTQLSYRYTGNTQDGFNYSDISIRFGANISEDLWNGLDTNNHLISGFGVIIADGTLVQNNNDMVEAANDAVSSTVTTTFAGNVYAIDYFVPIANMVSTIGVNGNNYFWNLRFNIDESDMNTMYSAVAYIKVGNERVLMKMARESVETLALDYLANRGCNETTAEGSLQAIVDNAA